MRDTKEAGKGAANGAATPDPTDKSTNWEKAEEGLQKLSDTKTTARLSAPLPTDLDLSAKLAALDIKLPTLQALAKTELSLQDTKLLELQIKDGRNGLEARAKCTVTVSELKQLHQEILQTKDIPAITKAETLKQISEKLKEGVDNYNQALQRSPEAFLAAHVADLRAYRRQYDRGRIIKTPYVQEKIGEITDELSKGHVVFISGETGIGKTEVARIAAKSFSKAEPLLVRGYAGMSSDELFGHTVLTDRPESRTSNLNKEIDSALKVLEAKFPKSTEKDKADVIKGILTKSNVTTSEYVIGAVYQAADEGRVIIIDEANYIPPELIAKLNDIMTKRPDEKINVQEDGIDDIKVKSGFGIIFTGNINPPAGVGEQRYIGRYRFDGAFLDRMSAIPYGYLPQAVEGDLKKYSPEQKQLFTIAMTTALLPYRPPATEFYTPAALLEKLESRHGTCFLPGGERGIETVWRFCQFAAVTQRAFAGDIKDGDAHGFSVNGSAVGCRPSVSLSPRGVMRVIEAWRDDGFQLELDHYIAKHLLSRAIEDPKSQAYLYKLGKFFGFFSSEGWDNKPDYSASLQGKFSFTDPKNSSVAPEVVPARKSIEALYGEIPARSEWPDKQQQQQATAQDNAAEWINLNLDFSNQLGVGSSLTDREFNLPT